jgi:hypothetical protein
MAQHASPAVTPTPAQAPSLDAPTADGGGNAFAAKVAGLGGGGTPADAAFDDAFGAGGACDLPFRAEMESYFGRSFDDVIVKVGVPLGDLQATAAARGGTVLFEEESPSKETVAHELTHVVQAQGGALPGDQVARSGATSGPAGTTSPGGGAEREASSVAAGLSSGGSAPAISASAIGVARVDTDEDTDTDTDTDSDTDTNQTNLERLKEEAAKPDVDGAVCLGILNAMDATEKAEVLKDDALMRLLAAGLDASEILPALAALGAELKWKAYWMDIGGGAATIGSAAWQALILAAPAQEILELMGWTDLFNRIKPFLATTPLLLFAAQRSAGTFGHWLTTEVALATWLGETATPAEIVDEVGGPTTADADVYGVVTLLTTLGVWTTALAGCRGTTLATTTRAALRRMADLYVQPVLADLFAVRFNHTLSGRSEDPTSHEAVPTGTAGAVVIAWQDADIRAVWDQLAVLPDQDVSESTVLGVFMAISGDRASWDPTTHAVNLGVDLSSPERLAHSVRHEIGHNTHAALKSSVDGWLQAGVGFWYHSGGEAGAQSLIEDLGGFPSTYKDHADVEQPFGAAEMARVKALIAAHSGAAGAGFGPAAPLPAAPLRDPTVVGPPSPELYDQCIWSALDPRVHACFATSAGYWATALA